ncbi:hslVU complex proteolytic subunit, threonine peptidase, Clan T(1), family T1B [Novymonas esmeraldas]|uniref:ATP-dependent protease subunit HslV n=1 Tax=Novymonas esmeraldas TaxID=1808958 RepID=A0AAW0F1L1_9TRYP
MLRRLATRSTSHVTGAAVQARHTTILSVRKGNKVVLIGDRQVTLGERIVAKSTACKLRALNDNVVIGFAGSTADAFALMEKLENKLNDFPNQLSRAAVELAKDWRTDRALRRLEASLIVCSKEETLEIDGQGNVITPEEDGIVAIGSGGTYAKAAARALIDVDGFDAESIAYKAMRIATDIDVFSNSKWDVETLTRDEDVVRKEEEAKEAKEKEAKEKEAKEKEAKEGEKKE